MEVGSGESAEGMIGVFSFLTSCLSIYNYCELSVAPIIALSLCRRPVCVCSVGCNRLNLNDSLCDRVVSFLPPKIILKKNSRRLLEVANRNENEACSSRS